MDSGMQQIRQAALTGVSESEERVLQRPEPEFGQLSFNGLARR